jgi:diketogulonate reductase-like aldo/keto reductase
MATVTSLEDFRAQLLQIVGITEFEAETDVQKAGLSNFAADQLSKLSRAVNKYNRENNRVVTDALMERKRQEEV